ncbi:hypothetical protein D3C71_21930 [compost metagenome]
MSSKPTALPHTPMTWRNFWLGYCDWLNEQIHGPAPGQLGQPLAAPSAPTMWWLLLVIPAGVLLLAVCAPLFAPVLVQGMSAAGTTAVANASIGLSVVVGLAFAVGIPSLLGLRLYRFTRRCCERGAQLQAGVRQRAWPR